MLISTLRLRVLNHDQSINDIKVVLDNFLVKSNIDYELMQSENVERLHEWLKLVMKEDCIERIFNEKWLRKSTTKTSK